MYNHVYQLTHDMDCFFVLNGDATHIATNGEWCLRNWAPWRNYE